MAQMTSMLGIWNSNPTRHSKAEDLQGLVAGSLIAALGLYFLAQVGLLTGGMAGLAFVLHYWSGWSFGLLFFLLNLPFYILSLRRVGLDFTIKTFIAVGLTSVIVEFESRFIDIARIEPLSAACYSVSVCSLSIATAPASAASASSPSTSRTASASAPALCNSPSTSASWRWPSPSSVQAWCSIRSSAPWC